jgi:hypothetical protein
LPVAATAGAGERCGVCRQCGVGGCCLLRVGAQGHCRGHGENVVHWRERGCMEACTCRGRGEGAGQALESAVGGGEEHWYSARWDRRYR